MLQLTMRAIETKEENGVATTTVIASTDRSDRADDIVEQSWKLDSYKANPVVQWAHRYDMPPVGKATDVAVRNGQLEATIKWDTGSELGRNVARQYKEGFLSAVSVGFRGERVQRAGLADDDARKNKTGNVFRNNELLEISAVPVPMNSDALAQRGLPSLGVAGQLPLVASKLTMREVDQIQDWLRALVADEVKKAVQSLSPSDPPASDPPASAPASWFDDWGSK